jgi:starch phosphorylase
MDAADAAYRDKDEWTAKCIKAACSMWAFSSDRTIREYARDVWGMEPQPFNPPHHARQRASLDGGEKKNGGSRRLSFDKQTHTTVGA